MLVVVLVILLMNTMNTIIALKSVSKVSSIRSINTNTISLFVKAYGTSCINSRLSSRLSSSSCLLYTSDAADE